MGRDFISTFWTSLRAAFGKYDDNDNSRTASTRNRVFGYPQTFPDDGNEYPDSQTFPIQLEGLILREDNAEDTAVPVLCDVAVTVMTSPPISANRFLTPDVSRSEICVMNLDLFLPTSTPAPILTQMMTTNLVQSEREWQQPVKPTKSLGTQAPRVYISRWTGVPGNKPLELTSDYNELHFVTYSLKRTTESYFIGERNLTPDGVILPGRVFMHAPTSQRRKAVIHDAFDFFRIYFPQNILNECFEAAHGRQPASDLVLFESHFQDDRIFIELSRSLINMDDSLPLGPLFADSIGIALAAHMIRRYTCGGEVKIKGTPSPLSKLRLARIKEYIEAHLDQPIYLAELSTVAGLSRMHFAAQFRTATGMSPHRYVLMRKTEHAKLLLFDRGLSITHVAYCLGFSSQAHFIGVFKKYAGDTPSRWRQAHI